MEYPAPEQPTQERVWRDPEQLEPYLDDELEHTIYGFKMGVGFAGGIIAAALGVPDDPLLDAATTPDQAATAAALRALERLSPEAADFYRRAQQSFQEVHEAPAAVEMLGHALRELDGIVRDVWWDLMCFVDEQARQAREDAIGRDPTARDAQHTTQIRLLSRRLKLTPDEEQTWLRCVKLHEFAHRGRIGPSRRLSPDEAEFVEDLLVLFIRIVQATESTYGDAVLRAAAFLEAAPTSGVARVLTRRFPHHPPLRRWFLAQIDHPLWLRPLHKADMLAPAEPLYVQDDGSPVAPMSPGARATARVAGALRDDALLKELISGWLSVNNPRLHTDVIQILVETPSPLYKDYVAALRHWLWTSSNHRQLVRLVGDLGSLRFPSHCLRLADRALRDGQVDLARHLANSTAEAMAYEAHDEESFLDLANLALLGAEPVLSHASRSLLIDVLRKTGREHYSEPS